MFNYVSDFFSFFFNPVGRKGIRQNKTPQRSKKFFKKVALSITLKSMEYPFNVNDNDYTLIWFDLIWLYSISTIVGYSMPNPFLYI